MKRLTTCKKPRRYSYAITRIGAVVAICLLMGICYVALRQPLGLGQPSTNRPIEEKFQVLDRPVDIPAFALPDAIGDDELQRVLRAA